MNPGHVVVAELEGESGSRPILCRFHADNRPFAGDFQLSISRLRHENLKREGLADLSIQLAVEECAQSIQVAEERCLSNLRVGLAGDCSGYLAVGSDFTALLRQFALHDVDRSLAFLIQNPLPNSTYPAAVRRPKGKLLIFQDQRFFPQCIQREIFALTREDCVDLTCRSMASECIWLHNCANATPMQEGILHRAT